MPRTSATRRMAMFHRRVLVLMGLGVVILALLSIQAIRLTIFESQKYREAVEAPLTRSELLPTWRGRILARNGEVLAVDEPSWEAAVPWDIITGARAVRRAASAARKEIGPQRWRAMSPIQRDRAVTTFLPEFQQHFDEMFDALATAAEVTSAELDERLDGIRRYVQHTAAVVWDRQAERHAATFGTAEDAPTFTPRPIAEQVESHVVVTALDEAGAMAIKRVATAYPDVLTVQHGRSRTYPNRDHTITIDRSTLPLSLRGSGTATLLVDDVAGQTLGRVRSRVWAQDLQRRPFVDPATGRRDLGGYRSGDEVGATGLESAMEDTLRGLRGQRLTRVDTDIVERIEPEHGEDVTITIDLGVQAQVEAILDSRLGLTVTQPFHSNGDLELGTRLNAAAVVLEIATGDIIAMAGTPGPSDDFAAGESAVRQPWIRRPLQALYPPGSIIKPLVIAAAMTEGVWSLGSEVTCEGHYFPNVKNVARCWIYRPHLNWATHGDLDGPEALARSCNCFFYTLADRLGPDQLLQWYRRFGLGSAIDIDGDVSAPSTLPSQKDIALWRRDGALRFETVSMGIGQGSLTWTPLHAAWSYALLATNGTAPRPSLLPLEDRPAEMERPEFHVHPGARDVILTGLKDGIEASYGSAHHISDGGMREPIFSIEGVDVWGKTGTAQAPPMRRDSNSDGVVDDHDAPLSGLHHSWFVGLAGQEGGEPTHAIAVIVEHGGSGGRVAGPIANQIIHALHLRGRQGAWQ